jgi:hypothetical protein
MRCAHFPDPAIVLDATDECDCIAHMNKKIFAALSCLSVLAVGCVGTVGGTKTAGIPLIKDKIESRYERPMDQVFQAAKEVVQFNGTLLRENIVYGRTNSINNVAKVVEGKVNQRTVWVSVEQVEPRITAVAVQTRTPGGGSDIDLAAEIDKQIALKLVR